MLYNCELIGYLQRHCYSVSTDKGRHKLPQFPVHTAQEPSERPASHLYTNSWNNTDQDQKNKTMRMKYKLQDLFSIGKDQLSGYSFIPGCCAEQYRWNWVGRKIITGMDTHAIYLRSIWKSADIRLQTKLTNAFNNNILAVPDNAEMWRVATAEKKIDIFHGLAWEESLGSTSKTQGAHQ